jgi:2-dehydro-3-deoxygalactonokinase
MSSAASEPALIGVDWGTSSLRACLIARDGAVLDRKTAPEDVVALAHTHMARQAGLLA